MGRTIVDSKTCSIYLGRTVPSPPYFMSVVPVSSDKSFKIQVPYQGEWILRMDAPELQAAIVGPVSIAKGETRKLQVTQTE